MCFLFSSLLARQTCTLYFTVPVKLYSVFLVNTLVENLVPNLAQNLIETMKFKGVPVSFSEFRLKLAT